MTTSSSRHSVAAIAASLQIVSKRIGYLHIRDKCNMNVNAKTG